MAEYKFKFSCRIEMDKATFLQFLDLKNMYFRKIGSDRDFSKWADIEPSAVTKVQSSSKQRTSLEPSVNIGSKSLRISKRK